MQAVIKYLSFFILVLLLAACSSIVNPPVAQAADQPRLLVVGEDYDKDSIARSNQIFKRVEDAINTSLIDRGFDVRDEVALTHEIRTQGRVRRQVSELIPIAKDVGADILIIFSIYDTVTTDASSARLKIRVTGRIISVYDGARIGSFEAEPQRSQALPLPYTRQSVLSAAGKQAKIIAEDVADVLGMRIKKYLKGHGQQNSISAINQRNNGGGRVREWTLILEKFTDKDITDIKDELAKFPGYDRIRIKTNAMNTSLHHEFWYYSNIGSSNLRKNIQEMLDAMGIKARIYFANNEFRIVKLTF